MTKRRSHHAPKRRLIRYAGHALDNPGFGKGKILMAADFKHDTGKGDAALETYSFGRK